MNTKTASAILAAILLASFVMPAACQLMGTVILSNWFAASTEGEYNRLLQIKDSGDQTAFQMALQDDTMTGDAIILEQDDTVYIDGNEEFEGLIEIHYPGQTDEFWTTSRAIKAKT
jgi:hypothetical protein